MLKNRIFYIVEFRCSSPAFIYIIKNIFGSICNLKIITTRYSSGINKILFK